MSINIQNRSNALDFNYCYKEYYLLESIVPCIISLLRSTEVVLHHLPGVSHVTSSKNDAGNNNDDNSSNNNNDNMHRE